MSETEHIKGKIRIVEKTKGMSFEEGIKIVLKDTVGVYYDIDDEYIDEESGFIFANGIFFEIVSKDNIDPYNDIQRIKKVSEDSFEFEFKFYNGGTCFSEMLEDSLTKLNVRSK